MTNRAKAIITILALTLIIALPAYARHETLSELYARQMVVTGLDYDNDTVYLEDCAGFEWSIIGIDDYYIDDCVVCIMDNKGTVNITDDAIIKAQYSGYWIN